MNKRSFLISLIVVLGTKTAKAIAGTLKPTPSQTEGPFYPVVPIPNISDLLRRDGNTAAGTRLDLSGRVVDQSGRPLENVRIEIWQADAQGRYRHPSAPENDRVDPGYAGFGATVTSNDGAYAFTTIVPVPYTGRPPHIHARLHRDGDEVLTTQIYLDGKTRESGVLGSVLGAISGGRDDLQITLRKTQGVGYSASFDFCV